MFESENNFLSISRYEVCFSFGKRMRTGNCPPKRDFGMFGGIQYCPTNHVIQS